MLQYEYNGFLNATLLLILFQFQTRKSYINLITSLENIKKKLHYYTTP